MTVPASLADDNIRYLKQGLKLLVQIDDETYRKPHPPLFSSGIGAHIRHNIDHYRSFLNGLADMRIDYDARGRDKRLEIYRDEAAYALHMIMVQLRKITEADTRAALLVKMDSDERSETVAEWRFSTIGRELQFLVSHTVHHYALVAVLLGLQGIKLDGDFGLAPSTLRYQKSCVQQPG